MVFRTNLVLGSIEILTTSQYSATYAPTERLPAPISAYISKLI